MKYHIVCEFYFGHPPSVLEGFNTTSSFLYHFLYEIQFVNLQKLAKYLKKKNP